MQTPPLNRRQFIQTASLAAAAIATPSLEAAAPPAPTTLPFGFAGAPVVANPSPTSVTIIVPITAAGSGWVEYGPTEALGQRADGAQTGMRPYSDRLLKFTLDNLRPGQQYHYRVQIRPINFAGAYKIIPGEPAASALFSFRTLDTSAASASFTVWNDTHENKETLTRLSANLQANPTDFLMWNGDVTNDVNAEERIIAQFLAPAGQPFATSVPMFLTRGNHDVRGKAARMLPEYLTGPGGRYHYAFRHGPVGVIVLDTGEDKPDDTPVYAGLNDFDSYRSMQRPWLERAIADPLFASAPYRIAFMHIPLVWETEVPENWPGVWGKGIKGWICEDAYAKWHDLLVRGRVHVVMSGHTHRPVLFPPSEKRPYAQLIGGGPRPAEATQIIGRADAQRLTLSVLNLDGKSIIEHTISA